ncbi:MAG: hypothetical protein Q9162_001697 [Coniocarpon cinnabarinum]
MYSFSILTLSLSALTVAAAAAPTNNAFHPDRRGSIPCSKKQQQAQEDREPPAPGPYHLSATLSSQHDGAPTYPNLCVLPATYSEQYYIGTSPHCQSHPWFLKNNTLSTAFINDDDHSVTTFVSQAVDLEHLSQAGQYISMQPVTPEQTSLDGDYGVWGNGRIPNHQWPNGILRTLDTPGEFSNWWLCPVPDGSEGLVLKYGFHRGFGSQMEERSCEMYTPRLAPVVKQPKVVIAPKVVGTDDPEMAKQRSNLSWLQTMGFGSQCQPGEFRLACWAQRKVMSFWGESDDF